MGRMALSNCVGPTNTNDNNRNNNNSVLIRSSGVDAQEATAEQQQQKWMTTVAICSRTQHQQQLLTFYRKWRPHGTAVAAAVHQLDHHSLRHLNSSSSSPFHCRHSLLLPHHLIRLTLLVLFAVGYPMPGGVTATARLRRTLVPLGMDKQMFPPQLFDENAPICTAEREPCGFYSFSLDGKAPLKWIKSWCRCSAQHECVYERTDMRMRVYRQTCISLDDLLPDPVGDDDGEGAVNDGAIAQRQQQSVMLVETVPPSTTSADRDPPVGDAHPQRTHRHHHRHHHRSTNRLHRHNVVTATAARHSRRAHRQRQVIRRLREIVIGD